MDLNLWKKSTKDFTLNFVNNDYKKEDELKKERINNKNNSTLSLHISAYENSNEAKSDLFDEGEKCLNRGTKQRLIIPRYFSKNPFEFPRQQESDMNDPKMPEISQFRASQRLLNPNQINRNNYRQQFPEYCREFNFNVKNRFKILSSNNYGT
uniref:Uncharacterized protein n=1 Tax=Panagrolaimus davidi TaxID=227884 RepID=A0A914QY80_9BILA